MRTPHLKEFGEGRVYWKRWAGARGEAASAPLKFLRYFLAPLASLPPASATFRACSAAFE